MDASRIINIEQRKLIWIMLSELYLDTALQEGDFERIAAQIVESPYSLEEVKKINKYEVFPVLQPNLLSVAGEWSGFREEWLMEQVIKSLRERNFLKKIGIESAYLALKWMSRDCWDKIEIAYNKASWGQV